MRNSEQVQKLIDKAPKSWKEMFKRYGLGAKPKVSDLINTVLEYTPTMQYSGEKGKAQHKVPSNVQKEAWKGLKMSWEHNYTSKSGIGLVRAMQLVVMPKIWDRSIDRMDAYFTRHEVDKKAKNFGNDKNPSRGYMAWLVWGGDSGRDWAKKVSKQTLTNPKKVQLVPKEEVVMIGFCPTKTKVLQSEIPHILGLIEQIVEYELLFPSPIQPMNDAQFRDGRKTIDKGHPNGAGHGMYDTRTQEVFINPRMEVLDMAANIFHENLHHALPNLDEITVRDTTGYAMLHLYDVYTLGKPFAEGRLKANPKKKEVRDSQGRLIPDKYLKGYKGNQLKKRIAEIEQRRNEYQDALNKYGDESKFPRNVLNKLYRQFETDKGIKSQKSQYTKESHKRGFKGDIDEKAESASLYYGGKIPKSILKTIMDRGRAAWASGGHRAGQTPESWGYARINSFLVGGKTFWTADADLTRKLPKEVAISIADESVYSPSLSLLWN